MSDDEVGSGPDRKRGVVGGEEEIVLSNNGRPSVSTGSSGGGNDGGGISDVEGDAVKQGTSMIADGAGEPPLLLLLLSAIKFTDAFALVFVITLVNEAGA